MDAWALPDRGRDLLVASPLNWFRREHAGLVLAVTLAAISWTSSSRPGTVGGMTGSAKAAAIYFGAWLDRDVGRLHSVLAVANWMHVADGTIDRVRVAFDARGIASAS